MYKTRYFTSCAALIAAVVTMSATARADEKAANEKEQALIRVLQSDAPAAEKAITCKQLAVFGTKDAVPALAPLLSDKRLSSWARIALEVIPGAEADKALRDAMAEQEGRLLIGVINSIGVRRDTAAVDGLAKRLVDGDTQVASAAAVALGRIGNAPAAAILQKSIARVPAKVRSAVAEGGILCAERFLAAGQAKQAIDLYDLIRKANVPRQRILEATRGAILARRTEGIPLLVELLRSSDKKLFQMGLMTARELSGREVTDALAGEVVRATPNRGALLLQALAARGDTVASPVILKAARSGPKRLRISAIDVLGRMGDVSCIPTLLQIAVVSDTDLATAAMKALAEVPGKKVNAEIAARLSKADRKTLPLLIELVGQRQIDATPALVQALDHSDTKIRSAALTALGATVGPNGLSVLIARVTTPKNPAEALVAQRALRTASVRMPDTEASAGQLVAAMEGTGVDTKRGFLEVLGAMGGKNALRAIGAAAKNVDPQLQDTASRLLGQWMTADAAPVLLDLTKTAPENKYRIRALRGYIRIARQFSMPIGRRAEMCSKAFDASTRTAEQKLVLQVLGRYPSVEMLGIVDKAAKIPALKNDAVAVGVTIAKKLGGKVDIRKLLIPVKLEIIKAQYGAGAKQKDVTAAVRKHASNLPLITLPSPKFNTSFGGDPAPGVKKHLKIEYKINGKAGTARIPEDALILLPVPK